LRALSIFFLLLFWVTPFVTISSLLWAVAGPALGLSLAFLSLIAILLFMEQLLISLSGAVPVSDQAVLDRFNAQVFQLGLNPKKLYYTEKFKGNLFDLPSILNSKGILISKDLMDKLSGKEQEILFYGVLYKSEFMDGFIDKLGAILFSIIRFPENILSYSNKKVGFFFYLIFKFLLSPLEILEKKFFDKENISKRIADHFSRIGKDSMVLISLGDKIKISNDGELGTRSFSSSLIYKFSFWPNDAIDLYDLFFDLAPENKQSWKSI
jgi:hypothetical protein